MMGGFDAHYQANIDKLRAELATALSAAAELRAENERLREELKPFVDFADPTGAVPDDYVITGGSSLAKRQLTMRDCRNARAALSPRAVVDEGTPR